MEASETGFDALPKEIQQHTLSYLDTKSIRAARDTSRLFRKLLYSTDFVINNTKIGWFELTDHLQKYYSTTLVGLAIKSREVDYNINLIENLSHLSALSLSATVILDPKWLCSLTQLNKLDFGTSDDYDLSELIHHLTNLYELHLRGDTMPSFSDALQNTKLTNLTIGSGGESISSLVNLRCLTVVSQAEDGYFLTALTDLEKLSICLEEIDGGIISTINSTKLTNLVIGTHSSLNYDSLSKLTSLRELEVVEYIWSWSRANAIVEPLLEKVKIGTLSNLTSLELCPTDIGAFEQISTLTNLRFLQFDRPPYLESGDDSNCYMKFSISTLQSLEHLRCEEIITTNLENDLISMTRLTCLMYTAKRDNNNFDFFETAPIQHFHNTAWTKSPDFWRLVTKCTTLRTLRHKCGHLEDHISALTALSRLECLDLDFNGEITASHFISLTSLRTLLLHTQDYDFDRNARETLRDRMTWLEELNYRHSIPNK